MSDETTKRLNFLINMAYISVLGLIIYIFFEYIIWWIMPLILAFGIASVVQPIISFIKRNLKIEQSTVALCVMLLIYASVVTLIVWIITQFMVLINEVFSRIPEYYNELIYPAIAAALQSISYFLNNIPDEWQSVDFTDIQGTIINTLQEIVITISQMGVGVISGITGSIPAFLVGFVFTIMLSFFMSMQYDQIMGLMRKHIPSNIKNILKDIKVVSEQTLLKYIKACMILMVITFIILSIGFSIVGVQNAIAISAGIAIFDAFPVFGTGGILIPWAMIELIQGNVSRALELLIIYGVVTLSRNILEPKVVGTQLGLNPIVSLVSIYAGFRVLGVFGMIIAPIFVQMILDLHKNGTINLLKIFK